VRVVRFKSVSELKDEISVDDTIEESDFKLRGLKFVDENFQLEDGYNRLRD
jgi:hypothetical protein